VVFLELKYEKMYVFGNTFQIHSLLGFVIGLLLVFRTNTAYERWWEGRKQWGALVNNSRNFALKINAMLPKADLETRLIYKKLIPNYVFAMKEHLREGVVLDELEDSEFQTIKELEKFKHVPNQIAQAMYTRLQQVYKEGKITGDQLITIDRELNAFTDIIGACERIKKTPIPFSYNLFLKKFIFAYTLTLPFGLAYDLHYWTIPVCTFILYIFGSLELLAEEIEDPFGKDANDLNTDGISETIRENVREILN
jgi:putative membrane protein